MDIRKIEKISRALSDAHRIAILQQFRKTQGCLFCADVYDLLELSQPSVSLHLKKLVEADLVIPHKEGTTLRYTLNCEVLNDYIDSIKAFHSLQ